MGLFGSIMSKLGLGGEEPAPEPVAPAAPAAPEAPRKHIAPPPPPRPETLWKPLRAPA